jgi:hypothetical protein
MIEKLPMKSPLRNNPECLGFLVVQLNGTEIGALQLDGSVQNLVERGCHVGDRNEPRAQLV